MRLNVLILFLTCILFLLLSLSFFCALLSWYSILENIDKIPSFALDSFFTLISLRKIFLVFLAFLSIVFISRILVMSINQLRKGELEVKNFLLKLVLPFLISLFTIFRFLLTYFYKE